MIFPKESNCEVIREDVPHHQIYFVLTLERNLFIIILVLLINKCYLVSLA